MIDKLGEDKQFIEIINTGTKDKPYYEIKYLDRITGKVHIGYSSYKLDVLSEFLREDFILSRKGHWIRWREDFEYVERGVTESVPHCQCSECKKEYDTHTAQFINYCPNCGAEMESE